MSETKQAGEERILDTRGASDSCVNLANGAVASMNPGDAFVLVADHDPIGLRYMFEAEQPGVVSWEALENGPELWRARVSRTVTPA